jgi:glycerol kinase
MMNIGHQALASANGMVSTICWSIPGRIDYALEGVIVSCGSTIEWLKNTLQLFKDSKETEAMAREVDSNGGVYLIPAFSGLGSPHWQMQRKASLLGLTFGSTKEHIVRAALESIAYQIKDVIAAMESDAGTRLEGLKADGGIASNAFVLQFTADLLERNVETMHIQDISALGAALLAGIGNEIYTNMAEVEALVFDKKIYTPDLSNESIKLNYQDWQAAIEGK